MSKSPRSLPAICVERRNKKNCQNGATQPPEQNAHACAHIQAAKPQPQGRTPVPTRCLLALCGCGLQGTLCRPGTRGPGCAGDLTARTKQQWPVQKWPGRGLEKGQEKEPAVLLITSGREKTEPEGRTGQSQTQLRDGFLGKEVIFRVMEGLCGLQGEMVGKNSLKVSVFHFQPSKQGNGCLADS